mmetsp:Transcript_42404/g.73759  ORF Transcript_42404/g.73759 Transcript_42404/m.73759 type:complete len:354 (-) Transcript_42404:169-1230(-)
MRANAVLLAYLAFACGGHRMQSFSRRMPSSPPAESQKKVHRLKSFTSLLLMHRPSAAGFHTAGPGLRLPKAVAGRAPQPSCFFENLLKMESPDQEMVLPSQALPGRDRPMMRTTVHCVLHNPMDVVPDGFKVAVFANGCFWGSEKGIWRLPGGGIYTTAVGYCAGYTPNPNYEEVCTGNTGHTEGVRVVYDPEKISFVDILRWFWEAHDPTSGMGQGMDRGTQYRSGFWYFDDEQKALIQASKQAYQKALKDAKKGLRGQITTEIAAASSFDKYGGLWNYAEPMHQQYLAEPYSRKYCSAQPQCVSLPPFEEWAPPGLEHHAPKLPEAFWKKHAPGKGCKVVYAPTEPIEFKF